MSDPSQNPQTQRLRVIYHGRVQGVGFRYTTASIARRHPVTGYVKNLRDGTVELVAEGPAKSVDAFVNEVADTFSGHITRVEREEEPSAGFRRFGIEY